MDGDEAGLSRTSFVLLERVRDGDDRAAEALFDRYFERLAALARSRLSSRLATRTDPEDVVLSAYRSFFIGVRAGRFTLTRGGDLWRLLASITKHKLLRQVRRHDADRRAVGLEASPDRAGVGPDLIPGRGPTPDEVAAFADELEWVLARLDPTGRRVLELRLQGARISEIADDTGRSERTVRRLLGEIRAILARRRDDA